MRPIYNINTPPGIDLFIDLNPTSPNTLNGTCTSEFGNALAGELMATTFYVKGHVYSHSNISGKASASYSTADAEHTAVLYVDAVTPSGATIEWASHHDYSFPGIQALAPPLFFAAGNGAVGEFPGYDFDAPPEALAFDYNGDGYKDLFIYQPGYNDPPNYQPGKTLIARSNGDGTFTPVHGQGNSGIGSGIAGFPLDSPNDQVLAFDFDDDGKDDLFIYRPGGRIAFVAKSNGDGTFTKVDQHIQGYISPPVGNYAFDSTADRAIEFGDKNFFFYQPGSGKAWLTRPSGDGEFGLYAEPSLGIAGYDLLSPDDRVIAFAYSGGRKDALLFSTGRVKETPGLPRLVILRNRNGCSRAGRWEAGHCRLRL